MSCGDEIKCFWRFLFIKSSWGGIMWPFFEYVKKNDKESLLKTLENVTFVFCIGAVQIYSIILNSNSTFELKFIDLRSFKPCVKAKSSSLNQKNSMDIFKQNWLSERFVVMICGRINNQIDSASLLKWFWIGLFCW